MLFQLAEFLNQPLMLEGSYASLLAATAKSSDVVTTKAIQNDVKMAATSQASNASKSAGKVIAVLPVRGMIVPRDSWILQMMGGTALDSLMEGVDICLNEPRIGGIVFDFDTPGGVASGVKCAADYIYGARSVKPMVSVVRYTMASAGYYLGAATSRIIAEPTSMIGSVGSAMEHYDYSKMLEEEGIKPTIFRSPEYKMEGHPDEPLTDEARSHFQSRIDELTNDFQSDVAKYRGVDLKTVVADFGKGRTMSAKDAVKCGMIDKMGTFKEVCDQMASGTMARSLAQSGRMEGVADTSVLRNRMAMLNVELSNWN